MATPLHHFEMIYGIWMPPLREAWALSIHSAMAGAGQMRRSRWYKGPLKAGKKAHFRIHQVFDGFIISWILMFDVWILFIVPSGNLTYVF